MFVFKAFYGEVENCVFNVKKYFNGNTALEIFSTTDGPQLMCTTNNGPLPSQDLAFIKNYNENDGVFDVLNDLGVIAEVINGDSTMPLVRLDLKRIDELSQV